MRLEVTRRTHWVAALSLVATLGAQRLAWAHPHVFVDYAVVLLFGADGITGLQFTWIYDDLFSGAILESVSADPGHPLSASQSRAIEARHFQPLRKQQYFLDIRLDGTTLRVDAVRDFHATVDQDRVAYTFVVPVTPKDPRAGALEVRVSDPAYYVAFDPRSDSPVRSSGPPTYAVSCLVVPSSGSFESAAIRCTYRRRGP